MKRLVKKRLFHPWVCLPIGLLLTAVATAFFYLNTLSSHLQQIEAHDLKAINQGCVLAVETWRDDVELRALYLARNPDIVSLASAAVTESTTDDTRLADNALLPDFQSAVESLKLGNDADDVTGVVIADRDGRILVPAEEDSSVVWDTHDHYTVFQLKRAVVSRLQSSRDVRSATVVERNSNSTAQICAAGPIAGADGTVVAAVVVVIDPSVRFDRYFESARFGESGETFAFDEQGRLLTPARFASARADDSVSDAPVGAASNESLRVPGEVEDVGPTVTELPLKMNDTGRVSDNSGPHVDGYHDYGNVEVVGSWIWLKQAGFGIATQVEANEAYASLIAYRNGLSWGAILAIAIFGGAGLATYMRRRRCLQNVDLDALLRLGQYVLDGVIGHGGMGTVYLAKHQFLKRPTAVKLIHEKDIDNVTLARFEREVKLASILKHPNTVRIYDYGLPEKDVFYYAMEYIEGITLDELVKDYGRIPEGRVIFIMKQICNALQEAHEIGLIHRDVKPANVLLSRQSGMSDFVKLVDFGLVKNPKSGDAKLTRQDVIAGTPEYVSPEAIESPETLDHRADIYSLGAVGYFLLTGRTVYQGKTAIEIAMKRLSELPVPPSELMDDGDELAPAFERLILECLSRKPDDRPQSAKILKQRLEACAASKRWSFEEAETWWELHQPTPRAAQDVDNSTVPQGAGADTVISDSNFRGEESGWDEVRSESMAESESHPHHVPE